MENKMGKDSKKEVQRRRIALAKKTGVCPSSRLSLLGNGGEHVEIGEGHFHVAMTKKSFAEAAGISRPTLDAYIAKRIVRVGCCGYKSRISSSYLSVARKTARPGLFAKIVNGITGGQTCSH